MTTPIVELESLDHLWFQIAGTLCNLTCDHCFITCGPTNRSFEPITTESVRAALVTSRRYGVKEYFFTGGEPFLHRQMVEILEATLEFGPATVLTNGTLFKDEGLRRLARAEERSIYSLELRISIDGFTPEQNDPIRGNGTFDRAMRGVAQALAHGFLPLITVMKSWDDADDGSMFAGFVETLRRAGYSRPRIKLLPPLRIGREVKRSRGYGDDELITEEMMAGYDTSTLICSRSRVITDRGVYVCPILIDSPDAKLGDDIDESFGGFALRHRACHTCWLNGSICSNPSSNAAAIDLSVKGRTA